MKRLCLLLLFAAQPAFAADHDAQLWTPGYARLAVAPRTIVFIETAGRFSADRDGIATALVRGNVGYALSDRIELGLGAAHFSVYDDGRQTQSDNRLFQQVSGLVGRIGNGELRSRTRLEQRFVSTGEDTGWRLRQLVRASWPVSRDRRSQLYISTEPFIAFNDTDWGANKGLDQVRTAFGVAFPAGNKLTADIGYLNQWISRERREDAVAHVLTIALTINL